MSASASRQLFDSGVTWEYRQIKFEPAIENQAFPDANSSLAVIEDLVTTTGSYLSIEPEIKLARRAARLYRAGMQKRDSIDALIDAHVWWARRERAMPVRTGQRQVQVWRDLDWVTVLQGDEPDRYRVVPEDGEEFTVVATTDAGCDDEITKTLRRRNPQGQ